MDTTAPTGAVSLAAGGPNAAIQINMTVSGKQEGTATFQINRDWSLVGGTFTGSNPETFTVLPREAGDSLTLSTSGTISAASGQALGNFTLAIGAFDITNSNSNGAKLSSGKSSNYVVKIVAPSDTTPPVITPNVSGTLGNGDWYTSDVIVSWNVADVQSAVTSSTGCGSTTISTDTTSTILTCSATSGGGTTTRAISIKRDATAPTLEAKPTAAPNGAGYNNSPVDVSYTCSDGTSGLFDPCPATDQATTDGTHTFAYTIHDNAGNSSSVSTTVKLDATKPTIASTRTAANGEGWNNSDVTVTFTCTDSGTSPSGIKSCVAAGTSPASNEKILSADGTNQSVSVTAIDNADNTNTATVGDINIDKTLPVIALASRTPANTHGWNNTNVILTWTCTDPGSGSGVVHETVTQTRTEDGAGQTATGICMDLAGNSASDTQSGINIDQTAPVIEYNNRTGTNEAGWNNTDVTLTWNCTDLGGSAVLHAAVSKAVSTEGLNQPATGTCEDGAGNTASDTQSGINIDKTAPGVVYTSALPPANLAGWNNTNVIATFTATDSLSGFAGPSKTTTGTATTSGEGTGLTVTSPAFTDLAGNTADAVTSDAFNVDTSAPNAPTASVSPAANDVGWHHGSVTVSFAAAGDNGPSGVASCSDPVTVSADTAVAGLPVSGTCTDKAGNTSLATTETIKLDKTPPTVSLADGPSDGASYYFGSVPPAPTCVASDALSGLAGNCVVSGGGTTVASHFYTATATDVAGNVNTDTHVYTVSAWTLNGFYQPVDMNGFLNTVKGGSTVPLKFKVFAGTTELTDTSVVVPSFTVTVVPCPGLSTLTAPIEFVTTGGTSLRYDSTSGQFIQNWKTPTGAGKCYDTTMTTLDGSFITAHFKIK